MTSFWEILKSSKSLKASDAFAELWGKSIADSWDIITITGALPLTFEAKGEALTNYRLYGTENGAGVETENLFDYTAKNTENGFQENSYLFSNGLANTSLNYNISEYIEVLPNTTYTIAPCAGNKPGVCEYGSDKTFIVGVAYNNAETITFTTTATTKYIRFSVRITREAAIMITPGSTAPPSYIPPGYQIPLTLTSGVTENLFDGIIYQDNTIITAQSGTTQSNSNYALGNLINIGNATDITMAFQYGHDTTTTRSFFPGLFYDAQQNLIGTNIAAQKPSEGAVEIHITVPANATYFQPQWKKTTDTNIMIILGSTAPDHYIPHRYTADYNLYIGSTKLGAEEYLDYGEQKIYKDVSGTLTPTDPPVPFPAIQTYQGENTLSSEETVGEVSVTGKIKEI